jgi:uncharacterized repeat protein (TIGR02543 family)/uncharacterized protein (TIGR02145 family)
VVTYTITYYPDGGTGANDDTYTIESATVTLPTGVTKSGYTFAGWYDNSGFSGSAVTEIPTGTTGDQEFWAKWDVVTYTITYNLNSGTGTMTPTTYTVESATINLPTPSRDGYTFDGWYDNSGFSGSAVTTIPTGSTGNKTYYAKWNVVNYTITYNLNSGTGTMTPTSYTVESAAITLPTPTLRGNAFVGWYEEDDFSGSPVTAIPAGSTGDKVFYAKWIDRVVINGVTWAVCNVDAPGAFAESPESAGMFYQWNRRTGWSSTDATVSGWDDSTPSGTEWIANNDPCPSGWRVPTLDEQYSLRKDGSNWTTQNGVDGKVFGIDSDTIFLPAAGYRDRSDGTLNSVGSGYYWSSIGGNDASAYGMFYNKYTAFDQVDYKTSGFSVRCVQDNTTPSANYTVTVSANPTAAGTVSGGGTYDNGDNCTVTATPADGYTFVNWTENGTEVSTEASYTFPVSANRTLVANFGVEIGGVVWATRNVDAPGTFAESPESAGMFYQWNRRTGWSSTGATVSGWDDSTPSGTEWEAANDPCPTGWRVPTSSEIQSLLDDGTSIWETQNSVTGRIFGTNPNTIFLPAADGRNYVGTLDSKGTEGYYWSSAQESNSRAYCLGFYGGGASTVFSYRSCGFSVRCVKK